MEKEREVERRVEPPPAERDDVRVAGSRCPYCHEDVARETADVCRDCLARHHAACWAEAPRCGACGSPHVLQPALSELTAERLREELGAALRREGLPDAEAQQALAPKPGGCASAGCRERGIAAGNASPRRHCRAHAASCRSQLAATSRTLVLLGLSVVVFSAVLAVMSSMPAAFVLCAPAALMCLAGVSGARIVRNLPPISPPDEGAQG